MSMTRKEFFRQAVLSLSKAAAEASETLKAAGAGHELSEPREFEQCEAPPPEADPDKVAVADNGRCLARSCGCFSCIERCEIEAISVLPGIGVRVDQTLCTGCGTCEYLCPVFPKAIAMQPRPKGNAPPPPL
jgi:Na+-translocating ferredoxin:NAD+ oxidoreductase RNF subunit RnfB